MKSLKLLVIFVVVVLFSGCGNDIDVVKKGVLEINMSKTVGKAIDKYKYFSKTEWKKFEDSDGLGIVEAKCRLSKKLVKKLELQAFAKKMYVVIQFVVVDEEFEIYAVGFEIIDKKGESHTEDQLSAYDIETMFKEIYKNIPLS